MDRNRLKEVHTSDLTESKVNEDFVSWLKNNGPTYLLVVLVLLCGYILWVRWGERKESHISTAWASYFNNSLPSGLEDVAKEYDDVGALPEIARLKAAQILLRSVQTGKALGVNDTDLPVDLTEGERTANLTRADNLYRTVVESDDESRAHAKTLVVLNAMFGRAAVAEARGDFDQARQHLEAAATRADSHYPVLAEQARSRLAAMDLPATLSDFPTSGPTPAVNISGTDRLPLIIEPVFADLIAPDESNPILPIR